MANLEQHYAEAASKRQFVMRYLTYLSELMTNLDVGVVERIIDVIVKTGNRGGTVYFLGNGGSAATASHFANDLGIGTRTNGAKPFKAISLVDNLSIMTALANDQGYEHVFLRQLEGVLQPDDVVVALSVSGNSPNVIEAVRYAKTIGALTIGCTGFEGGSLRELADISFHVPTSRGEYGPVEDLFMILDHLIYSYLKLERCGHL